MNNAPLFIAQKEYAVFTDLSRSCFLLCVLSICAPCAPTVLTYTRSAGAGDVIYLQGSDFGSRPLVEYAFNDSEWKMLPLLTSGQGVVTGQVPGFETRLPALFQLRVTNDNGNTWSKPVYVNKVEATSFNTDTVAPNSSFQAYGRNLYLGHQPTIRLLDLADGSSHVGTVDTTSSTNFLLNAIAPADLVKGHKYRVYLSNGSSSDANTESLAAELLTGRDAGRDFWGLGIPWASDLNMFRNVYNVKTDPRLNGILAKGDNMANDAWPIMNAIQTAFKAGGGVVYLPDGHYNSLISNGCAVQLLPKVVLQGAGQRRTFINYGYPAGSEGAYGMCFASQSGLSDLTMQNVDTAQQWKYSGQSQNNSEVFLKRVTWNIGTSQWLNFVQDDHVTIQDSIINQGNDSTFNYLGPLNMQGCVHCEVRRSAINFTTCGLLLDFVKDFVFDSNEVTRDISVSPPPQTVTHHIAANFAKNLVVTNSIFRSVGRGLPTNNDGEVINSEGGGGSRYDEFRGTVGRAQPNTLYDPGQNFNQSSNAVPGLQPGVATVAIVSGNGLGQTRIVTAVSKEGTSITVDHPWDVQPEPGSHYATFDWSAENWIIANNTLNGNFKGFEIFNASALNVLFQGNKLTDSDGIMISPTENPVGPNNGVFHMIKKLTIVGNTMEDLSGLHPAYIGLLPREDQQTSPFGSHFIGAVVKANNVIGLDSFVNNLPTDWDVYKVITEGYLCSYYWQSYGSYDNTAGTMPLLATLFQGNTSFNAKASFSLNSGASHTVMLETYISNAVVPKTDRLLPGATSSSVSSMSGEALRLFPVGTGASTSNDLVRGMASITGMRSLVLGHQGPAYSFSDMGDNLNLLGIELGNNGEVIARVNLLKAGNGSAALVMRGNSTPRSAFASISLNAGGIMINTRMSGSSILKTTTIPTTMTSVWLRLSKTSNLIKAMYSADGVSWTTTPQVVEFPSRSYLAGIASISDGTSSDLITAFETLSIGTISSKTSSQPGGSAANPGRNIASRGISAIGNALAVVWRVIRYPFIHWV